jgi:hypothetical protein
LRIIVALAAALSGVGIAAPAQKAKVVLLHPGTKDPFDREAIIIPAGSPLQLASFPRDFESNAVFRGRFTLSGNYEVEGYGADAYATIWPDKASLAQMPYWRERGGPEEMYLTNGWAFARAVVSPGELQRLKSGKLKSVHGRVTIIADDYRTRIECDAPHFSARFVSVAKRPTQIASLKESEGDC